MSTELTTTQVFHGLNTVRAVLAPDLTNDELTLFAMVANRSGLDPFAKQIYAVKRNGRVTFQTSIDGYRSIAARTGLYDGQDEPEFGPPCGCGDKRPSVHPEYATVRVYRKGVSRPIAGTAYWHEYKPDAGREGKGDAMWVGKPRLMLGKVAEALALRKAFPYDPERHSGIVAELYTDAEMDQADRSERPPAPAGPQPATARERIAARREAIASTQEPVVVYDGPLVPDAQADDTPETVEGEVVEEAETAADHLVLTRDEFSELVRGAGIGTARVNAHAERLGLPVPAERTPEHYGALWASLAGGAS